MYQGRVGNVDLKLLQAMERVTIGSLMPDVTFILDVPVEVGMQRATARRGPGTPDRFEGENLSFHQKLRDAYRQIATSEPERCVLIDATEDVDRVADHIWSALRDRRLVMTPRKMHRA